nr:MAG TPA: hypothetical protein [Caudoviricetes sp.]
MAWQRETRKDDEPWRRIRTATTRLWLGSITRRGGRTTTGSFRTSTTLSTRT